MNENTLGRRPPIIENNPPQGADSASISDKIDAEYNTHLELLLDISPAERVTLQQAEQASKTHMQRKAESFSATHRYIGHASYGDVVFTLIREGVTDYSSINLNRQLERNNILAVATVAAREISKKSTENSRLLRVLNEGLSLLDIRDIYEEHLKFMYPQDHEQHQKKMRSRKWRKNLDKFDASTYGGVDRSKLGSLLYTVRLPNLIKKFGVNAHWEEKLQEVRFTEELCRVMGKGIINQEIPEDIYKGLHNTHGEAIENAMKDPSQENLFRVGRHLFDHDRFFPDRKDSDRALLGVFGAENGNTLLREMNLFDISPEHAHASMSLVRGKQRELGMAA